MVRAKKGKHYLRYDTYFDSNFREVVGVAEFGGHVKLEVIGVLHSGISKSNAWHSTLLEDLLQQQGLQGGVQFLSQVF
jgi:hypothetical protein